MAGDPFTAAIFKWLNLVAADPELPPAAFRLAYIISQHINRTSLEAWPNQKTLANAIAVKDERSVRRLTDALEVRGHLITRRRKQNSMVYRLAQDRTELSYQATAEDDLITGAKPDEIVRSSDQDQAPRPDGISRSSEQDRTFHAPRPDNFGSQDRTNLSAKPLIEPLKEPVREKARPPATSISEDFTLNDQTQTWAIEQLGGDDAVTASLSRFRDHHRAKGTTSCDWQATARLWIGDDARSGRHRAASRESRRPDGWPTEAAWRDVLKRYKREGQWTKHFAEFGPDPESPKCRAPSHLLAEFGLAGSAA
ncbi:hypothetical protein CV770_03980 [Bradyrhizobium sp. AC87j1]|uniref:hypothetical protein n=1 Tax=Bradyrhizobium sp. AC87j1 TaxID=2055894 RepID=UPI000CEC95D3|nr:hypothetical protein [Bradyrhizobium sp. AC87j1]PPQ20543.1 hypothetical protein CV770_03980 [Bradyrhizobium sp. AC87j1]